MTLPPSPHIITGDKVTAPTEPKKPPRFGGVKDKLVYPGRQPYAMPEQMTGVLAVLQGMVQDATTELRRLNDSPVLYAGIIQLDADGMFSRNWDVQFRCVSIANLSGGTVTIAPGGAGDPTRPPTVGPGVHQIPAGNAGLFAVMGNSLAVYGPADGYVDVGVATRWLPGF